MTKNAAPRDARAGYQIYRAAAGDIGLDDLNEQLVTAGYGPVSNRMFTHYRHLAEAGYNRYISINRFDVARAASRHEDLGASPRYPFYERGEGVRLLVAKSNRLWGAFAQVESVGEAGAVLRFVDDEYAGGLADIRARKGDEVSLNFLESGVHQDGWIVDVDLGAQPPLLAGCRKAIVRLIGDRTTRGFVAANSPRTLFFRTLLEVQFGELVSLADLAVGHSAPVASLGLRLRSADDDAAPTTDQLGRRLHVAFELVDELRAIANTAVDASGAARYSPPAVVERLSVASPAEFWLTVSEIVKAIAWPSAIGLALRELARLPEQRKAWLEGDILKEDLADRTAARALQEVQRERDRAVADLARQVQRRLEERYRLKPNAGPQVEKMVIERVGPLLEALAEAGIVDLEELDDPDSEGDPGTLLRDR